MEKYLDIICGYIRGEVNLENATLKLVRYGFKRKSVLKVLKDVERRNIIELSDLKNAEDSSNA